MGREQWQGTESTTSLIKAQNSADLKTLKSQKLPSPNLESDRNITDARFHRRSKLSSINLSSHLKQLDFTAAFDSLKSNYYLLSRDPLYPSTSLSRTIMNYWRWEKKKKTKKSLSSFKDSRCHLAAWNGPLRTQFPKHPQYNFLLFLLYILFFSAW